MEPVSIAIAYCIDNLPVAEGIEQALSPTRYVFQHFYCKKSRTKPHESLSEQLKHHDGTILLLVSDNFMKSLNCMNQSLKLIQSRSNDIIPIVVDGRKLDEESGEYVSVSTRFEKIGDIIPYINFWQNQYLDLRSQRSAIESETNFDKESFSEHLRVLRQVSSEASEFLRVLRNMPHYTFDSFSENHFEVLFQFLNDDDEWEAFRAKSPILTVPDPNEMSIEEETPAEIEPEGQVEEEISEEPADEELVTDDSDFPDIPGMDLLEGRDKINKIIQNKKNQPDLDSEDTPIDDDHLLDLTSDENVEPDEDLDDIHPEANPQELFEALEEDDPDDETDIFDDLLVDENLGGPASSKDEIEEEQVEDMDPAPDDLENEEEEMEIIDSPFEDVDSKSIPKLQDLSEEFDHQIAEAGTLEENPAKDPDEDDNIEELIEQAFALANADQMEDATTFMEQATKKYPNNTELRYHFALMLAQNTSEINSSIDQLEVLLEMAPTHLEGNYLMGELSEIQEEYGAAKKYYKQVLAIDPTYQDVYARMGIVALSMEPEDKKRAMKYFKKALKVDRDHIDANYQYALLVNELKDKPKKAIKYLKRTIQLQPNHPFANYDLALLYHQLESPIDAHFYYQKAIAINPELQTADNDAAFSKVVADEDRPKAKKAILKPLALEDPNATEPSSSAENVTLAALKENIEKLEGLLAEKVAAAPTPTKPKVDKTVLITGATSGIGRATAITFGENGYRLILNGRRQDRLEELRTELEDSYQSEILLLPFDVRDLRSVQAAVENLPHNWQKVDVLVNNAGKAKGFAPIHEGELDHWEEMIDVNVKGLLYLTRAIAPSMVAQNSGHIINLGSTAGKEVYPNGNVYCATKFAVDALTKAIRLDLFKHNIRVSQVSPGHVEETEFALVRFDGDADRAKIYEDFNPLTSRDVAETIFFIASRAPHINIQDVLMMGTQQAGSNFIDRSGRSEEEE